MTRTAAPEGRPVRAKPTEAFPSGHLLALSTALAYAGGGWMVLLHVAEGGHEQGEPPLLLHWLRDASLALPVVLLATWVAAWAAGRLAARLQAGPPGRSMLLALTTSVTSALAFAAGEPAHEWLFGAHETAELPIVVHLVRDASLALAATLPVALAVTLGLCALERLGAARTVKNRRRRPRRRIAGIGLASLLGGSVAVVGLAGPASAAPLPSPGQPCPTGAPARSFDVEAVDVKIPINRFGDNDPNGKMFVAKSMTYNNVTLTNNWHVVDAAKGILTSDLAGELTALQAVRHEEASQWVAVGLRDNPIQPLSIRANLGDCVTINFKNSASGGEYGLHIDGLSFTKESSGDAVGQNPNGAVGQGSATTYRYYVPTDATMEGSHYIHSGPGFRSATDHGLFGTLTVEPKGAVYLDPDLPGPDGKATKEMVSGWEAIIQVPTPAGALPKSFYEAVKMHHEIGNDNETINDKNGSALPQVDSTTGSYRPGEFALNYRSEPFRNRLLRSGIEKSHSYSSYTFGDPATIIPRGYLGMPTKFRVIHASGEKFHVYHLHGGGDRWRFNPVGDPTWNYADTALNKHPKNESASNRLDAQSIGPGESYNLELEGGAGGVQHSVGDLLFHCHISKHYVSGMWGFWRVYNTEQPDFAGLPDRPVPANAVTSDQLIGKTFDNGQTVGTHADLNSWIRQQLPAQGAKRNGQDPSVFNWKFSSAAPDRALGEPEDTTAQGTGAGQWADQSDVPGHPGLLPNDDVSKYAEGRPAILFNPVDGRPAYPLLRTHIAQRPPFAPQGHSGSPFLGEHGNAAARPAQPDPYANRPDGLCPSKTAWGAPTPVRTNNVVAVDVPIRRNNSIVDNEGKLYVLANDKDAMLAGNRPTEPLALRANVGDCVKNTLTNEMTDAEAFDGHSKTTMHIHHVQFDVQGSDGVSTGYAYEHSVRPYKVEDPSLTTAAAAGDTTLQVSDVRIFQTKTADGDATHPAIGVGMGTNGLEVNEISGVTAGAANATGAIPGTVTLSTPLKNAHPTGEAAGFEFIQYEWYADTELDNVFWHDHVDGIHGWGHGLLGQLIVEPAGSKYYAPGDHSKEIASGTVADIVVDPSAPGYEKVATGRVDGSFRELALWTINDNDQGAYSTVNLKAAPFSERPDNANRFSSYTYGDPRTPMLRGYPGDDLVVRTVNVGPSLDTLRVAGSRFSSENRFTDTRLDDTIHYGISEKYTLALKGGPSSNGQLKAGDYLYYNGDARRTEQGAWGIVRVQDKSSSNLLPLPGAAAPAGTFTAPTGGSTPPAVTAPSNPCPTGAPLHSFAITALDAGGKSVFVETGARAAAVQADPTKAEPLVLHVAAGECVKVSLTNGRSVATSFAMGKLDTNHDSAGVNVGTNPNNNTASGATRDYYGYADTDRLGTAVVSDMAGGNASQKAGLYGAIVVAPKGAKFTDPVTAAQVDIGARVDVHVPATSSTPRQDYRDFSLLVADDDPNMSQDFMPYPTNAVPGKTNINYQVGPNGDSTASFNTGSTDPKTPVLKAYAGDPVVVHQVVAPGSEQGHVFNLGGLSWNRDSFIKNSEEVANQGIGPWESFDASIIGGAGGRSGSTGDWVYGDARRPFTQVGAWGLQRVLAKPADCATVGAGNISCLNPPAPTAAAPTQAFVAPAAVAVNATLANSTIPVSVKSSGTGEIGWYKVEVSKNGSTTWTSVGTPTSDAPTVTTDLAMGTASAPNTYQFRSTACNINGCSTPAAGPKFTLAPVDDTQVTSYSGSWSTQTKVTGAYSGTLHYAGAAGANAALNKVTYTTSGNAALVSTLGPDRGLLSVSVDGAPAQQFSTYAATQKMAQVIFNTNLPAGTHTVTVTVLGKKDPANSCTTTGCGTRVDVDAFALIK